MMTGNGGAGIIIRYATSWHKAPRVMIFPKPILSLSQTFKPAAVTYPYISFKRRGERMAARNSWFTHEATSNKNQGYHGKSDLGYKVRFKK